MDPRQKLCKTFDQLSVDPNQDTEMSDILEEEVPRTASDSGVTPDKIRMKLEEMLEATYVEIEDLSGGCGQMYEAIIVSPQFAKKTTLARHRLVNNMLKEEIAAIHAWTPKCHTPEEWEKKRPQ